MKPILLIHGYSAESETSEPDDIKDIYGTLPAALDEKYGDGLDDISRALDRALHDRRYRRLLRQGFHAIVHSSGSLVLRNWLRRFSARPSPLENLIHLAGANFGSGLAHIGKGQLAKWGRLVLWAEWKFWLTNPQAQYDGHPQAIFRRRDQDGRPVENFDIFFESQDDLPIKDLIEDCHKNKASPGILVFYLRTDRYDADRKEWVPRIPRIGRCTWRLRPPSRKPPASSTSRCAIDLPMRRCRI